MILAFLDVLTPSCDRLALISADGQTALGLAPNSPLWAELQARGEWGKSFGNFHYLNDGKGRLALLNLGEKVSASVLRKGAARLWREVRQKGWKEVTLDLSGQPVNHQIAILEGLLFSDYQYLALKSEPSKLERLQKISLVGVHDKAALERAWATAQATLRARDLAQMPANVLDPVRLAQMASEWAETFGFKAEILEEDAIKALKMGALLSVAAGSAKPPRFLVLDYHPENATRTFVFVGKAVTFDSGGLSLKPGPSMPEMKGDMAGGAAVVALMTCLRENQIPFRVVGLVPAVENMPSGSATRPSDVVTSMSGITIEINNTDAEGRLILADALTYADRFKPDYVIDFATLTGACLIALGTDVCGLMGNDPELVARILQAGKNVDEPFWELPLVESYDDLLKSQTADVANVAGTRYGGAILAGLFLQRFAKKYKWAHCDIAACLNEKPNDLSPAGGNGLGVRTALELLNGFR
ncbi:MAG: leucyl aminopeptidase [Acidobacteria bacterium]|nr:leucyl aminopeptidase [Acidobacteriota bacterium]